MEEGRLWRNVMLALHRGGNNQFIPRRSNATGVWKVICDLDKDFAKKGFTLKELIKKRAVERNESDWIWDPNPLGTFTVKLVRRQWSNCDVVPNEQVYVWNNLVPKKVNIFGWRLWLDRLPTKLALERRNVHLVSNRCAWCDVCQEDSDHIFSGCLITNQVWLGIARWCKISPIIAFIAIDLLRWYELFHGDETKKRMVQAIMLISCWVLWKARNNLVFNGRRASIEELISEVKTLGLLWLKNRAPSKLEIEKNWRDFDFGV